MHQSIKSKRREVNFVLLDNTSTLPRPALASNISCAQVNKPTKQLFAAQQYNYINLMLMVGTLALEDFMTNIFTQYITYI